MTGLNFANLQLIRPSHVQFTPVMQTFQDLILRLQDFWAAKGCLIWQPYNQVVGAGTMNPATFLRVLGPEPWNVAYVEPSARPDDGRFGQNPNRLYTHTQFQVILKPSPERSQELYLESLSAIGIDLTKHDVRFVEDNWAQPAIGAWGLGWEVWLDGLEITQYTYFQQVGGVTLDPISLELTYGLERIAMALQNVRSVFDLKWDANRTYGDVRLQDERERSEYAFNQADVEELHEMFELYERECKKTLSKGLVLPSHDYVLQCSNVFNLLDTRGAIGVTERARYLGRMRGLAEQVALTYVAQRKEMGYPWLKQTEDGGRRTEAPPSPVASLPSSVLPLLIELGTEELPADNVPVCEKQLRELVAAALDDNRIAHGAITSIATPRRTAVLVADVAPMTQGIDQMMKGPSVKVAFDKDGKPTPAAVGFAKRFGMEPEALVVQDDAIYARKVEAGRPTSEVLAGALPAALGKISFEKTMRWNASNVAFSRAINWIAALLGESVIPFEFAGVRTGNESTGVRGRQSPRFVIKNAADYLDTIAKQHVVGDTATRKEMVRSQVEWIATGIGGRVAEDDDLLDEVTNLVEEPNALLCAFPAEYLDIPAPVLMSVMRKKQRYFTVLEPSGEKLMPYFITVRNGPPGEGAEIRAGNEDVVNARFADAAYFFREDIKKPLADLLPRLDTITFQGKLGSMLDKTKRIEASVDGIATLLGAYNTPDAAVARKAAHLCKADLASNMVVEITQLQGTMGREYYLRQTPSTEPDRAAVADVLLEHYYPRYAGDKNPKSLAGLIVGLADKLDSIAGLFSVGLAPKGSADPFALRRAAIGIVQNLIASGKSFSLRRGLEQAGKLLPTPINPDALNAAHAFIIEREKQQLLDEGFRFDVVDAVLAEQGDDPARARASVAALNEAVKAADWPQTLAAFARCARITKNQPVDEAPAGVVDPEPSATALAQAAAAQAKPNDVQSLMANLRGLVAPINTFFTDVMVMAEDANLRKSRLALLNKIVSQMRGIADLSKLEGF